MNRKHMTGRVVTYLVATVAGTILLSLMALDIMWKDARGYADEGSLMSGLQFRDGFVSALTAFVYVAVFATLIRGIAFSATGGGTVLDSPSTEADGDRQTAGSIPDPTPTPTEVPTLPPVEKENSEAGLNNDTQNHE